MHVAYWCCVSLRVCVTVLEQLAKPVEMEACDNRIQIHVPLGVGGKG